MGARALPVVVARWFRDGVGYAYNHDVDSTLLAVIVSALGPVSQRDQDHTFRLTLPDGQVLIGSRDADPVLLDALAEGRRPYIIRAAVCPPQCSDRDRQEVLEQLTTLDPPDRPGLSTELTVHLVLPSEPPPVPVPSEPPYGLVLWSLAALLVTIDMILWLSGNSGGAGALFVRVTMLLAVVGAAAWLRRKPPTSREMGHLEWEWYADAEPNEGAAVRVKPGARIITPDGRESTPQYEPTLLALGVRRVRSSEVVYREVQVAPGAFVLAGTEAVTFAGQEVTTAFTRSYVLEQGRWRLSYAQWTVVSRAPQAVQVV
jgi:hypothetical protein